MTTSRHSVRIALLAALAFFLFTYLVALKDAGRTYDDAVQRARGAATFELVAHLGRKPAGPAVAQGDPLYGPFAVTLATAVQKAVVALHLLPPGAQPFQGFFAGVLLFAALLVGVLVWLGGRLLGSASGGLLCALLLLAMPRFWGMACNMPSDIPAAGLTALALAAWWAACDRGTRGPVVLMGVALGLLAAVRMQNAVFVPVVIALHAGLRQVLGEGLELRLFVRLLLAIPVALVAWLLAWPDFWLAPIHGPLEVLRQIFVSRERGLSGTLWFGELVTGPRLYPLVWLLLATPTWLLVAALLGLLRLPREAAGPAPLLCAWCAVAIGKHLTGFGNYGGLRHFVDGLAPLAGLAALGTVRLAERWLAARLRLPLLLGLALLAAALGFRPAPYGDNWFSQTFGGLAAMPGRFDLDPNGAALLPGLRRLAPRVEADAVVLFVGNSAQLNQLERTGTWLSDGRLLFDLLSVESARYELAQKKLYYLHHADLDPFGMGGLLAHMTAVDALTVDGVELVTLYRGRGLPFLNELRVELGRRLGLIR